MTLQAMHIDTRDSKPKVDIPSGVPSMNLLYVHDTSMGYGRYGMKLAQGLDKAGIHVDDTLDSDSAPQNLVCWVSTPTHAVGWHDAQWKVISTMWEAQRIPEDFRQGLHNFDQVIVPSQQNLELFSRYHANVAKVPLGVDSAEWRFRTRRPPTTDFRFLIGGSGPRKGQDLAYKAFRKVFKTWPSDGPRPVLQFKSPKPCEFVGERIEHIGGKISNEAERDLYGAAHCYLQPSRGEGFGLQPLQAIAQGLPTILTDAHGQAEFAYLGLPISATSTKADYFIYGDAGDWWEPSLDELCEQMEDVYFNYDRHVERAREASVVAHRDFNWQVVAQNYIRAIGRERFEQPYTGTRTWQFPDYRRYLVRVDRPWKCEIAQTVLQFEVGKDYWEISDIKRILMEADVLDPSCVEYDATGPLTEVETGLTEKQLAKMDHYRAMHSYCHHCGQKLNTGEMYQA